MEQLIYQCDDGTVTIIGAMNPILKLIMRIIQRTTGKTISATMKTRSPRARRNGSAIS